MSSDLKQNSKFSGALSTPSVSVQSVLDVFVVQGLITQQDSDVLKSRYKTNRDLENILIRNKIASRQTINKAYSILLKIPFVSLENAKIEQSVLQIIPKAVAEKYNIVAFGLNKNILQVAITRPMELNLAFKDGLEALISKTPYVLALYITSDEDIREAFKQYSGKGNNQKLTANSYPIVFLRNQSIPKSLLQKLPKSFIEKHRATIYAQQGENIFFMAAEKPDDSEIRRAVEYVQQQNKVIIQLMATSKDDIDYVLSRYDEAKEEAKTNQQSGLEENQEDLNQMDNNLSAPDNQQKDQKITVGGILSFLGKPKSNQPVLTIDQHIINEQEDKGIADGGITMESDQNPAVSEDSELADNSLSKTDNKVIANQPNMPVVEESSQQNLLSDIETQENSPDPNQKKESSMEKEEPKTELSQEELSARDENQKQLQEDIKSLASPSSQKEADLFPLDITEVTSESETTNKTSFTPTKNNLFESEMEIGSLLEADIKSEQELKDILTKKYIPQVVAAIINYALFLRSSDVHIEAGAKDLRIRYRVDGILRDIAKLPLEMHPPVISRIKILAKMKIDETRIPQDGRFDVIFKRKQVDVRVSALPTVHGEKMVLRVLDKDQSVLSLEDLGMVGRAFEITVENIAKPYGIILSTGPTGSGKSTTLYAILNRISTPSVNIITLEDPVEYEIQGVNQCQIKPAIGFSFAEGLRSVLRQDPNVVMVGEIRDGETAAMATHAALTGHLVLSTLHTNDASGALPRLTNMGVEPFLITSSINEIIAQRLVRRICPKCKEEMKVPQTLIDSIKRELDTIPRHNKVDIARIRPDFKFYHGVGCNECNNGYKGRVGIFEVLRMTENIESLAIDKRSANDIAEASKQDGMITMRQDGLIKSLEGITTIDEVYRATSN